MSNLCKETSNLGVIATSGGINYNLNDRGRWRLMAYAGHGVPNARRLGQRTPQQNGDTDLGFRIDPRFPEYSFLIDGIDLPNYYDLREEALAIFRPRDNDPVIITFVLPNGQQRALRINLDSDLDLPPGSRFYTKHQFSVLPKASDYRFFDPDPKQAEFDVLLTTAGLPIPFTVPIPIGASSINATVDIFYASGNRLASPEFPVVTVHGPIINPILENLTTDEKIDLSANGGLSLVAGEFVVIDLAGEPRRDSKTLRNQDGTDVSQFLTTDSDLATWHLSYNTEIVAGKAPTAADGQKRSDGNNTIRVQGTGINALTRVVIDYFDRYEGM